MMEVVKHLKMNSVLQEQLIEQLMENVYAKAFARNVMFAIGFYFTTKTYMYGRLLYYTGGRDIRICIRYLKLQSQLKSFEKENLTVAKKFKQLVRKHPEKILFYHDDFEWTFEDVDKFSNKVANFALKNNLKPGDEVALFMHTRPEYIAFWLGLSKIGVVTALINYNQRLDVLLHSINSIKAKALIFGTELEEQVQEILPQLERKSNFKVFFYGAPQTVVQSWNVHDLRRLLDSTVDTDPVQIYDGNFSDRLLYVYTSGTTGLPKAAIIKQKRFFMQCTGAKFIMALRNHESIYLPIPLYHSSGGVFGIGFGLIHGYTVALRNKFSASKFWADCVKYRSTMFIYVGELCRFLLRQPERLIERQHQVVNMAGNGLRPAIWHEFKERFQVKNIYEFYSSTEGNNGTVNISNQVGACGFIPRLLPDFIIQKFYSIALIKIDEETDEPVRDHRGLCIRCKPYESGELVGKINNDLTLRSFDGYLDDNATNKKIISNVLNYGDNYFSSGDILIMDEFGYLYFQDRLGDTFRWKSENVSTSEVEDIVSTIFAHKDCVVFGVNLPYYEGKAGMLILSDHGPKMKIETAYKILAKHLPHYAVPIFIRLTESIEKTATLKLLKSQYKKVGFNPFHTNDEIYYLHGKTYRLMNKHIYEQIMNGQISF